MTLAYTFPFAAVYADWCGPCKTIAPLYEQLAAQLTRPAKMAFCKVNTDQQAAVAQTYGISAYVFSFPSFPIYPALSRYE